MLNGDGILRCTKLIGSEAIGKRWPRHPQVHHEEVAPC